MFRTWCTVAALVLVAMTGQAHASSGALANGGFEEGRTGWSPVVGPYGATQPGWEGAGRRARIVSQPVHSGKRALLLDAVGMTHEVDATSQAFVVKPNTAYRVAAFVRQTAGKDAFKVTIDWQTAGGKHISYDNDWRGAGAPRAFAPHGGVFAAPDGAQRAVVILGVQKGVACVFDSLAVTELGPAEPLNARPRRDGDGTFTFSGPASVAARGCATWQVTYTAGASGVPIGGAVVLRRWPVSFDWSPPQSSRPRDAGYVTVRGRAGAEFAVQAGQLQAAVVRIAWPGLQPGETIRITLGDRSGGGPGMRVQGKVQNVRWVGASDCTADGEYRDCKESERRWSIVAGAPAALRVVCPAVGHVGETSHIAIEAIDGAGNVTPSYIGSAILKCDPGAPGVPSTVRFGRADRGRATCRAAWSSDGEFRLRAVAPSGRRMAPAEGWIIVSSKRKAVDASVSTRPYAKAGADEAVVGGSGALLVLRRVRGRWGAGDIYAWRGGWRNVAVIPAVARVAPRGWFDRPIPGMLLFGDRVRVRTTDGRAALVVTGNMSYGPEMEEPFEAVYEAREGSPAIRASFRLLARHGLDLCSIHAPIVYAGDGGTGATKAEAVFPGLEYLAASEVSSDDDGVSWKLRERWVPHPYKITVPAMAVATAQGTVGLLWDPLQRWHGRRQVPLAHFASPNRREHKPNHLLSLAVPGFVGGFRENVAGSKQPYRVAAGEEIRLTASILATPDPGDVGRLASWWRAMYGRLDRAPRARTNEEGLALAATGYLETMWDSSSRGWVGSIGWKPAWNPTVASRLLTTADLVSDRALADRCRAQVDTAVAAAGGATGAGLLLRRGRAEQAIVELRAQARAAMASQRADGTWSFAAVYSSEGARAGLAEPDDVEIGTCVNMLDGLLMYAVATGDRDAVSAGLRGLEAIRRFSKPCGSESWEVPLVCPNLRAAALASRCWLRGWQLTGRADLLQMAREWAMKGAAFIYCWQAPGRPVMPGASISVMGTTFYESGWFGWPVQWVGLVYAESILELARYDDSFDWRGLAELIVSSALRQQKTSGVACGHKGLIPDAYSLLTGADAYEWCIGPVAVTSCITELMGYAADPLVGVVPAEPANVHVLGACSVVSSSWDSSTRRLSLRLRHIPGSVSQVVLSGLGGAASVSWAGRTLDRNDAPGATDPGWRPAQGMGAMVVRLDWDTDEQLLILDGVEPKPYAGAAPSSELPNGGFEDGTAGWLVEPGGTLERAVTHSGTGALRLSSPDQSKEMQATSEPFSVAGGRSYRLSAWVAQVAGAGDYKVTVEWLTAAGSHLGYANDWQGSDRPVTYSQHGALLIAPPGAAAAHIILGCRGAVCLFDDVSMKEAR